MLFKIRRKDEVLKYLGQQLKKNLSEKRKRKRRNEVTSGRMSNQTQHKLISPIAKLTNNKGTEEVANQCSASFPLRGLKLVVQHPKSPFTPR